MHSQQMNTDLQAHRDNKDELGIDDIMMAKDIEPATFTESVSWSLHHPFKYLAGLVKTKIGIMMPAFLARTRVAQ